MWHLLSWHWGIFESDYKHIFVLKNKGLMNNCIGQRPTTLSGSTRSPQRFVVNAHINTNPMSVSIRYLDWVCGSFPSSKSSSWVFSFYVPLLQDDAASLLIPSASETSPPGRELFCHWHSCFQPVGPSCPLCQIVPWFMNYHYWAVKILISPSLDRVHFQIVLETELTFRIEFKPWFLILE